MNKTIVYIDSFNLYYGALTKKGRGFKWLDLHTWLSKLLPHNKIEKIKFFTAKVTGKFDPTKPIRQESYFRALNTLPTVEIIEGTFLLKKQKIHVTKEVDILATVSEEKGTDVNLAVHLVNDAHLKRFDIAVIVSNDSDLAEAVKITTQELNLKVGIINPSQRFNKQLSQFATFKKSVRDSLIQKSQFPTNLTDSAGLFSKPSLW